MTARILLVEDDENLRLTLEDNLTEAGHAVEATATIAAAEDALASRAFDLLVLDVMLPDGDGYALCRRLRARGHDAPILMLTARTLEDDVVQGFAAGADDYLGKPYRLKELFARVGALLRRRVPQPSGDARAFAGFRVDLGARTVCDPRGAPIALTRKEFDLLVHLHDHRGQALSRDAILDAVWGSDVVVDLHTVDNFISSLKRKLLKDEPAGFRISTVRGVGYRFDLDTLRE
jgi:DNA-binding response OmpR family regulator